MARELERMVYFDRPDIVRVAVLLETPGSHYARNLRYPDAGAALEQAEADVAELLTLEDLCAELQSDLAGPIYWRADRYQGFLCRPVDRRATIQEKLLISGVHFNEKSRVRIHLADELADEQEPLFTPQLTDHERLIQRCPKGCEYVERNLAALPFYLAEHRKTVREQAARLAAKRELWKQVRGGPR